MLPHCDGVTARGRVQGVPGGSAVRAVRRLGSLRVSRAGSGSSAGSDTKHRRRTIHGKSLVWAISRVWLARTCFTPVKGAETPLD